MVKKGDVNLFPVSNLVSLQKLLEYKNTFLFQVTLSLFSPVKGGGLELFGRRKVKERPGGRAN